MKVKEYIIDTVVKNGFRWSMIERRIMTSPVYNLEGKIRIGVTHSAASSKLTKTMKGLNINMVSSSRIHQLKSKLGSPKDRKLKHESSGMYKVECPDCEKCYIGQTKRLVRYPGESPRVERRTPVEKITRAQC